VGQDLLIIED